MFSNELLKVVVELHPTLEGGFGHRFHRVLALRRPWLESFWMSSMRVSILSSCQRRLLVVDPSFGVVEAPGSLGLGFRRRRLRFFVSPLGALASCRDASRSFPPSVGVADGAPCSPLLGLGFRRRRFFGGILGSATLHLSRWEVDYQL